jgi:hypothetical protein
MKVASAGVGMLVGSITVTFHADGKLAIGEPIRRNQIGRKECQLACPLQTAAEIHQQR